MVEHSKQTIIASAVALTIALSAGFGVYLAQPLLSGGGGAKTAGSSPLSVTVKVSFIGPPFNYTHTVEVWKVTPIEGQAQPAYVDQYELGVVGINGSQTFVLPNSSSSSTLPVWIYAMPIWFNDSSAKWSPVPTAFLKVTKPGEILSFNFHERITQDVGSFSNCMGRGIVSGGGSQPAYSNITLLATPSGECMFAWWVRGPATVTNPTSPDDFNTTQNPITLNNTGHNEEFDAVFVPVMGTDAAVGQADAGYIAVDGLFPGQRVTLVTSFGNVSSTSVVSWQKLSTNTYLEFDYQHGIAVRLYVGNLTASTQQTFSGRFVITAPNSDIVAYTSHTFTMSEGNVFQF